MEARIRHTVPGIVLLAAAVLAAASHASAHAFPDRSEPRVGSTVERSPDAIRIWFDGEIEPVFSTIRVENEGRQRVDRGDGHVNAQNNRVLEVSLGALPPGRYRVFWSVVARDGHRTEGDFPFRIK
jgi:methionine-rich copper-binding protein CopC